MHGYIVTAILAAALGAPTEEGFTESVDVYVCDFEHSDQAGRDADINYDHWPDRWTRRYGRSFPKYLKMQIAPDPEVSGNHAFAIELNGGGAEAYSPRADVGSMFSYRLRARLKTEKLKHDSAFVSITFYDADETPLESYFSDRFTTTQGWVEIDIGPITPTNPKVRYAKIGVHVRPGEKMDIWGRVLFDDIRLMRLPRMQLQANRSFHYYENASDVEVSCHISGIHDTNPTVRFELFDVYGNRMKDESFPLKLVELASPSSEAERAEQGGPRRRKARGASVEEEQAEWGSHRGYESRQSWRPELPANALGYYEVRASIHDGERLILERDLSFVVARPFSGAKKGVFGWSVRAIDGPVSLRQLARLSEIAGLHWIKLPVWFGDNLELADEIAWFAERMSANGVELVGVMDSPTPTDPQQEGNAKPPIALVFAEEDNWKPLINPVMTRLSLKMRWWQLGADDDVSYVGFPDLAKRIGIIKNYLERFGQEVRLGFSWPWIHERPDEQGRTWSFTSYYADMPLTPDELQLSLHGLKEQKADRWATLTPLHPANYSVDARARDLVLRMLEAKISGASAIFADAPFHPETGLVRPDGTPGAMLLPWRTVTQLVSGTEYVGSIQMPNGSHNLVLSDGENALMVVWSDSPTDEVLYLGEDVKAIDVWGRMQEPDVVQDGGVRRQVIHSQVSPTFLTGVSLPVALWRMSFKFDNQRLASTAAKAQRVSFSLKNPFTRAISARMQIAAPDQWEVTPSASKIELHELEARSFPFNIKLDSYAPSGPQDIRADFRIIADRTYEFSVYRTLEVGLGDIKLEVESELDRRTGKLIVYVHLDNNTDSRIRFNCLMFIKGRQRRRLRLASTGRGRTTNTFTTEDGASLIGKTIFVQARELGGGRILNYKLVGSE